jgi:hypothetical protein
VKQAAADQAFILAETALSAAQQPSDAAKLAEGAATEAALAELHHHRIAAGQHRRGVRQRAGADRAVSQQVSDGSRQIVDALMPAGHTHDPSDSL